MTFCKGSFKNEGVHVGWDKSYLEFLVGLGSATQAVNAVVGVSAFLLIPAYHISLTLDEGNP